MSNVFDKIKLYATPLLVGVIIACCALGLQLRLSTSLQLPLWLDEAIIITAIKSYEQTPVTNLTTTLPSGANYECYIFCRGSILLSAINFNTYDSLRFLAVIAGVASIAITAILTHLLFASRQTTLLATVIVTFLPTLIGWSATLRHYSLFVLLFLSTLTFGVLTTKTTGVTQRVSAVLTLICLLLTILVQPLGVLLIPIGIIAAWQRTSLSRTTTLITLFGSSISIFLLSNQPISVTFNLPYYVWYFIQTFGGFTLLVLLLPFVQTKKESIYILSMCILVYLGALSCLSPLVQLRYSLPVIPLMAILIAYSVTTITTRLHSAYHTPFVLLTLGAAAFGLGYLTVTPPTRLESDPIPAFITHDIDISVPTPPWQSGYSYIQQERHKDDTVISSFPAFTSIFLSEEGYGLAYDLIGTKPSCHNQTDHYMSAPCLTSETLKNLIETKSGFIILDDFALSDHIDPSVAKQITSLSLTFIETGLTHHTIYVYRF